MKQFTYRYYRDETINLNKYFRNYFKKEGKSLESMLNKYAHYDCMNIKYIYSIYILQYYIKNEISRIH